MFTLHNNKFVNTKPNGQYEVRRLTRAAAIADDYDECPQWSALEMCPVEPKQVVGSCEFVPAAAAELVKEARLV